MRRLILLALLVTVFSSCSQIKRIPELSEMLAFDFTEFSAKGFMFTPEFYRGEYESVGLLDFTFFPEAELKLRKAKQSNSGSKWVYEPVSPQTILEFAYQKASKMGANALVNFTILPETKKDELTNFEREGFRVKGFAIKRKK